MNVLQPVQIILNLPGRTNHGSILLNAEALAKYLGGTLDSVEPIPGLYPRRACEAVEAAASANRMQRMLARMKRQSAGAL